MDEVKRHYGEPALIAAVLEAIGKAGMDVNDLTVEDLGPVDEFHIGGRAATENLLKRAGFDEGSRVLDVGSGAGGTARYLAETGGHQVTGVDLTPEYVELAGALTELVGLEASVAFEVADGHELPFPKESFDAATMIHVGMNILDKMAVFSEVARVLAEGGSFAIYDIAGAADAEFEFPVPWAASPGESFLATADEYVAALEVAGFQIDAVADRAEYALQLFAGLRQRTGPPPALGLHVLMGDEAPVRYGNMVKAVDAGSVSPVEIIASIRKPQA